MTPLQEVQVLRIVQEALTNVRKHAEATEVEIGSIPRNADLEIEVRDNGKGFNPLGRPPDRGVQGTGHTR